MPPKLTEVGIRLAAKKLHQIRFGDEPDLLGKDLLTCEREIRDSITRQEAFEFSDRFVEIAVHRGTCKAFNFFILQEFGNPIGDGNEPEPIGDPRLFVFSDDITHKEFIKQNDLKHFTEAPHGKIKAHGFFSIMEASGIQLLSVRNYFIGDVPLLRHHLLEIGLLSEGFIDASLQEG